MKKEESSRKKKTVEKTRALVKGKGGGRGA